MPLLPVCDASVRFTHVAVVLAFASSVRTSEAGATVSASAAATQSGMEPSVSRGMVPAAAGSHGSSRAARMSAGDR
jgi:hypothetical protein